jgi:hypothetical protein
MSRTVTVNELITRIQYQADIQGLTVRHTTTELTTLINQAIQAHRERVSFNNGIFHYLNSYSSTFTAGKTSPFQFKVLDLSSGPSPAITRIYSIEFTHNGEIYTLDGVSFDERNEYSSQPSTPVAWAPMTTYKVAIMPAPDTTYAFTVWYLPKLADIATTETFDGVAGWEDEVMWEVCCRIVNRDQYAQAYQMFAAERDRAIAFIMNNARNPARNVISRRQDTMGKRMSQGYSRRRSPADQWWGRRG